MPDQISAILEPETIFADQRLPLTEIADGDLARVLTQWRDLRGSQIMPPRAAFRPEDLRYCIGRINLVEVCSDPADFVFRVRGTTIAQMHRHDMTGQSVRSMSPPAYRDMLLRHYEAAVQAREPVLYRIRQTRGSFHNQYRRLILPLSQDGEEVSMLLTVSCWDSNFARAARILGFS